MKKHINIIFYFLLISSITSAQDNEYWKNNSHTSWYSFMCRSVFGPSIEDCIPELIIQRDCAILTNPDHLTHQFCKNKKVLLWGKKCTIEDISCKIESGPTYQAFQQILNAKPLFTKYPIQLRRGICDTLKTPLAIATSILLNEKYYTLPDATKLFVLYHELQHHLYNDVSDNHLEKIINLASINLDLQAQLTIHKKSLDNHIRRYVEYRADTKAMESIECPCCLQEISQVYEIIHGQQAQGNYNPQGYLHSWQFEPRINELLATKKCCQHHHDTGKQINLSIVDESTLLNRLIIIQE